MYRVEMMTNGRYVSKIRHNNKTYLPVDVGQEFSIKIYNDSPLPICASVSCDGIDVIGGNPATHDDSGYIIGAWQSYEIQGWRTSDTSVAKFVVTNKDGSYSEKIGNGGNQGVIGVVIYPQKQKYTFVTKRYVDNTPDVVLCSSNVMNFDGSFTQCRCRSGEGEVKCSALNIPKQTAGTGFGQEIHDSVTTEYFDKDLNKREVIVLYYDTPEALRKRGVPVGESNMLPNPFPGENKYCKRV